ncbi:MAG TPA: hypothetical protein VFD58_16510, partial [Blastocatellia bacterium]|nr:hypothetical protein [Blastocatellia bacterium]
MFTLRQFSLSILLLGIALTLTQAQTPTAASSQAQTTRTSIIIERQLVRFITQGEAVEWHLVVTNQQEEVVFDSGLFHGAAIEWPLRNGQDEPIPGGLYAYTLTTREPNSDQTRTQRGHLIVDRASTSDRVWVTSNREVGLGTSEPSGVTVTGSRTETLGGVELAREAPRRTGDAQVSEGRRTPPARAVREEKQQGTSAVTASPNRLAKFAADGTTLIDSTVTESASGDIGIGTAAPGGVFDLQRSSAGDILQRLWNTGSGGAKLRYVAATGATSQLQLTDGLEWLSAIAGNNSIGLQFRVRNASDPNSEAQLNASARMTILRNGDVGIGTTAPGARLTVQTPGDAGYGIQHRSNSV